MELIEICRKFIEKDTSPTCGTSELVDLIVQLSEQLGFSAISQLEYLNEIEQKNILIKQQSYNSNIEDFLLQTHLDTVDPGPYATWTKNDQNPFFATIQDGCVYGLGAAEAKLDFVAKLLAMKKFIHVQNWKRNPILVGTYGEELGMQGALRLIRKNKFNCKMALIGEPSNLNLINGMKGFASIEISVPFSEAEKKDRSDHDLRESISTQTKVFHGKSAHSSTPQLGDSAIVKIFEYLKNLPESIGLIEITGGVNHNTVPAHGFLELDLSLNYTSDSIIRKLIFVYNELKKLEIFFSTIKDARFNPDNPTLNIGKIMTLQNEILIQGCCRIPPNVTSETWESWIAQISMACSQVGGEFKIIDYKKGFINLESQFLNDCFEVLKSINPRAKQITLASTNEASLFHRMGIECISFGAGEREGNIHTSQEKVKIEDLEKSIEFYSKIIERFCL